jgi:hypothetical protein
MHGKGVEKNGRSQSRQQGNGDNGPSAQGDRVRKPRGARDSVGLSDGKAAPVAKKKLQENE